MNFFNYFGQYIRLATIADVLDILIVAALLYKLMRMIKNTPAARLLKGVAVVLIIAQLASVFRLNVISFIMTGAMQLGAFAFVVVFQPELRRILEQFGKANLNIFRSREKEEDETRLMILQTVDAVSSMAWSKTGALIVFETGDSLAHIAATGTEVNADMTAELIKNIFFHNAPLHDGAMVVANARMKAAGCILPLTAKFDLSKELGTRHRAAIGITESCDCCCVVVSEETGAISFAKGGQLKRHLAPEALERLLINELVHEQQDAANSFVTKVKGVFKK